MNIVSVGRTAIASAATLLKRLLGTRGCEPNMVFRVMYVSPFFELEINTGNGWQAVHDQKPASFAEDGSAVYPVLYFPSFPSAFKYATENLGLTCMRPYSWGFFPAPPVSWNKPVEPRIIPPVNMVGNKLIPESKVQSPAKQLPAFKLYEQEEKAAA